MTNRPPQHCGIAVQYPAGTSSQRVNPNGTAPVVLETPDSLVRAAGVVAAFGAVPGGVLVPRVAWVRKTASTTTPRTAPAPSSNERNDGGRRRGAGVCRSRIE